VCSWSLRPEGPEVLVERVRAVGVGAVQLALDPLRTGAWDTDRTVALLGEAGIEIRSGMMAMEGEDYSTLEAIRVTGGVRPDAHWDANREAASANARLANELGVPLVTFHAGFLPEEHGPERVELIARLREIVDRFAEHDVAVAFETGQERAETLLACLDELERPAAGVNFDPANMILYAMGEPVDALARLARRVRQIHVKDARRTATPGTWGTEVVVGTGRVDWQAFFATLAEAGFTGPLAIEREAGDQRVADIQTAHTFVRGLLGAAA
jgi:sugar phosphate isomerase/epimerase